MEKIKWAEIYDYTNYNPNRCNNGGQYGFTTRYEYVGNGKYQESHSTTAEFEYCPHCGSFRRGSCCHGPQFVDEATVWGFIKEAENDPNPDYSAEYELFDSAEWTKVLRRRVHDALNKTMDENAIVRCAIALNTKLD